MQELLIRSLESKGKKLNNFAFFTEFFLNSFRTSEKNVFRKWRQWHWILWWGWSYLFLSLPYAPSQGPDGISWKVLTCLWREESVWQWWNHLPICLSCSKPWHKGWLPGTLHHWFVSCMKIFTRQRIFGMINFFMHLILVKLKEISCKTLVKILGAVLSLSSSH